jgi:hypothetical protein
LEQIGESLGVEVTHNTKYSSLGEVYDGKIPIIVKPVKGDPVKWETLNIASINRQMQQIMNSTKALFVTIMDDNNNEYNCVRCEKTKGNPKSDFNFVTVDGEKVLFISHKKSPNTGNFQQWGGILKDTYIKENIETKNFLNDLKQVKKDFSDTKSFSREITDTKILRRAMYGKKYENIHQSFSEDNVWAIIMGNVSLQKLSNKDVYKIVAPEIYYNGNLPLKNDLKYPVFMTRTSNDRSTDNIKGVRVGIYPRGFRSEKNQMKI